MSKKLFRLFAGVVSIALVACTAAAPEIDSDDVDEGTASSGPFLEETEDEASSSSLAGTQQESSTQEASSVSAGGSSAVRIIDVNVSDWAFAPTTITAKQGEKVQLRLKGDSGIHGFAIPGLSMNVRVAAGETVVVDLPTDITGSFEARCSIPCGPGHRDMKATIIVR